MNKFFSRWFAISAFEFAIVSLCNAQTNSVPNKLQGPPQNITIDGDLREWGDSLPYYNEDKHLNYALANDQETIYMAIRIVDRSEQIRVLRAGLTFSIDTHGKKKESSSITFPVGDQSQSDLSESAADLQGNTDVTQENRDELMRAKLTKLREIRVSGFKDIEGEMITTSNTYGIKTAIDYDKDGNLVYEASIPLRFFHADDLAKSEWAFNFKINGITRQARNKEGSEQNGPERAGRGGGGFGGGRGGRGGGRGGRMGGGYNAPVDRSELSKSVDFWEKFYLAK